MQHTTIDPALLQQAVVRGQRAKKISDDPAFCEIVKQLEQRYIAEWRASGTPENREVAWAKLNALENLILEFGAVIGSGTLASRQLDNAARRSGNPRI